MSQNEIASFANFINSSGPGIEQQVAQGLFEAGSAVVPGWDLAACVIGGCSKTDWALASAGIIPVGKAGTTLIKVYNKYGDVVGEALVKYGKKGEIVDVTKGPLHHICTNKNCISAASGGPWIPRFEAIFEKAGMNLNDALNKVRVPGHKGPHPEAYHQSVFDRLTSATDGLNGAAYKNALQTELKAIGQEASTPGSILNNLLIKQ